MQNIYRRDRAFLIVSLICLCSALVLSRGSIWLSQVTAPAARPQAVFRLSLPGVDLGADAWPTRPGKAGYVEVWYAGHDADDGDHHKVGAEYTPAH